MTPTKPVIGLALSGGGFRATAFGLGALRALHDRNILSKVDVASGISGGSLLTAMWAYGPADFDEFDTTVTDLLSRGLQMELLRRALRPSLAARTLLSAAGAGLSRPLRRERRTTQTEAIVAAFKARPFGAGTMTDVTHPGLQTIISATDLSTGNAVRFGSTVSSCSPHGVISEPIPVADAVAASAAFPVVLPHLARTYTFTRRDGTQHTNTMLMTDGGVYDNLGISPLLPGRSKNFTSHTHDLDYLIAVDAGPGRSAPRAPGFMFGRLKRSFEIAHIRSQDGTRARVHELTEANKLRGFIYTYLGMGDHRLPTPTPGLVDQRAAAAYPTNFAKMSPTAIDLLTTRGEQVTRALLDAYSPELGR